MARGGVVVYFSRFGKPTQTHHKVVHDLGAKAIAKIKGYSFWGHYDTAYEYSGPLFFVPDDTLLLDEASCLGIRSPNDLYGGVVPYLFVKTKAITHGLVDRHAERPQGWSTTFAERVREIVLPGYTVFSSRDARVAARRMLRRGPLRLKKPLSASGKDQTLVTTLNELDAVLEKVTADEMATYGLVLEENLRQVKTLSVGEVAVGNIRISYHGTQRTVRDNEGWPVYGGSDLVCVRGGWEVLDALPMSMEVAAAVAAARGYDEATEEYPGFTASRRNYDVGQGIGADGRPQLGVLEPSWRMGGATSAELVALAAFARDPSLQIVGASHVEEYGRGRQAPADAIVDFQGDDPEAGPLLRYTIVKPQNQQLNQKICGRYGIGLAGLAADHDPIAGRKAFTWSGPIAAIAAVGVARSAYEYVLKWAKTYTAGSDKPIIHYQAVGYALADVAMKIEACRAFSWKAAHYLDRFDSEGHAVGAMSKVLCGELLFSAVFKAMQVMGVNALDRRHPIERYLREALVFPLYDAGNIGMQMRKIWGVMADPDFDPRAIADSRAIEFKKSMEGWTAVAAA